MPMESMATSRSCGDLPYENDWWYSSQKIIGSQLQINSKKNQSIWVIFESEEEENLDNIPSNMVDMQNDYIPQKYDPNQNAQQFYKKPKTREESNIDKGMDEKTLRKNILEAFEKMNDDFIFIEPKLIPIIPGDDPAVINEVSEFSEDNY